MTHHTPILALLLLLNCAPLAAQTIYKHIDERGKVTYSNEPIKGGKKVDLPPISTVTLPKPTAAKPEAAPVGEADQAQRKKQLQEAIAAEEKALANAKSNKAKEDQVAQHEKKLAELKSELGRMDNKP